MTTAIPDRALRELGRTEGDTEALDLLVRDQNTRRLVLLRALLDAATEPVTGRPPELLDRLREDWALLTAAERADRAAARAVVLHPLVGPWAERCLNALTADVPVQEVRAHLGHLGALAAAAAIRAGLSFATRLTARGTVLHLPTLGAVRVNPGTVGLAAGDGALRICEEHGPAVLVRVDSEGASSLDPRWLPVHALPAVLPGGSPVPLDDLDPYRAAGDSLEHHGLSGVVQLDDAARKAWTESWSGVEPMLGIGGDHRRAEAATLLRCLVPLAAPPGSAASGEEAAHCSGTRREAFGAVLSSRPAGAAHLAATLVHELQHTKLAALSALVPLHHEDTAPRHFAPWRPDPRPFDGLLQGAYSHIALADYWQRFALGSERVTYTQRDLAWSEHARRREQVGAVLPVLAGSGALTSEGRVIVNEMITLYHRLADWPPPMGHVARARAYVSTARVIWQQRNHSERA
ncbi:HEXXH motif-containing putative peptide modification protein [Streptomyces sp900116325]|uniref:HEXXH motif-containing putative peptide modification protein n=2 Tax=Actinomycetes TaxID=1760 RepID=A0ABV2U4G4_9ACTN